jgi:hypothetical protein
MSDRAPHYVETLLGSRLLRQVSGHTHHFISLFIVARLNARWFGEVLRA